MELIADVGGTNTRCALVNDDGVPVRIQIYANADFESLAALLGTYLAGASARTYTAAIAVAAPITGDSVRMTNRQWHFSVEELRQDLGLRLGDLEGAGLREAGQESVRVATGPGSYEDISLADPERAARRAVRILSAWQ